MAKRVAPKFAPTAWQWDASNLATDRDMIQVWSAGGSCNLYPIKTARQLVESGVYFLGSENHICAVHDRIDTVNRP